MVGTLVELDWRRASVAGDKKPLLSWPALSDADADAYADADKFTGVEARDTTVSRDECGTDSCDLSRPDVEEPSAMALV